MQVNIAHNTEAALKREVEENSRRENFCERTVIVALIFEAVVLFQYSGDKPPLETALLITCNLLLAVAIAGEIGFGGKRSIAQAELQRLSDERVASSLAEAEQAKARAAEANQRAEQVRLELAIYSMPRMLDPEQVDRIIEKLTPFSGTKYDLAVAFLDPEFLLLLTFIEPALAKAGWEEARCSIGPGGGIVRPDGRILGIAASASGVAVGLNVGELPPGTPSAAGAGMALVEALRAEGIEVIPLAMAEEPSTVHIIIGPKPSLDRFLKITASLS
jgi:hypothetical protein